MEYIIVDCNCGDLDHIVKISYDDDYDFLYFTTHLNTYKSWYQRLWDAIKYVFRPGICRYGHYDEVIIDPKQYDNIINIINKAKNKLNIGE